MRRPLALAFVSCAVAMGVFLLGLLLIVDSSTGVSFPSSVAVTSPAPAASAVPVSLSKAAVGMTPRAFPARGGQATPASAMAGTVISVPGKAR